MKKIYLAGRVRGNKWKVAPKLENGEWVSSDGSNHSEHEWGYGHYQFDIDSLREGVNDYFIKEIQDCLGLVAYLDDDQSYGSIAEIAYAAAIGKSCHVILKRIPMGDGQFNDGLFNAYWFVCHFPGVKTYEIFCDCMAKNVFANILTRYGIVLPSEGNLKSIRKI